MTAPVGEMTRSASFSLILAAGLSAVVACDSTPPAEPPLAPSRPAPGAVGPAEVAIRPAEVTSMEFAEQVLAADSAVVVEFGAEWCAHCRSLGGVLGDLGGQRGAARVVTVDVDREPDLAERYRIESLPTVVVFVAGEPVGQVRGARQRSALEPLFSALSRRSGDRATLAEVRSVLAGLGGADDGESCPSPGAAGRSSAAAAGCELPAPSERC